MKKSTYSASILRYIHDQVTGEFVNIGIVLACADRDFVDGSIAVRSQRVTQFFPEVRGLTLRRTLASVKKSLDRVTKEYSKSHEAKGARDDLDLMKQFANSVVPHDDAAIQWSEPFTGITAAPAETLARLFERLIARYEPKNDHHQRTDAQIWSVFSKELEDRSLQRIEEHTISANLEEVRFKHALKNGRWHLLEPISFDLLSGDSIRDKAKRILGQMTLLKESKSDFELHFLIGEPSDQSVREDYETALKILEKVPVKKEIFPESRKAEFVAEIRRIVDLPH